MNFIRPSENVIKLFKMSLESVEAIKYELGNSLLYSFRTEAIPPLPFLKLVPINIISFICYY